jgi:hypothetical protein
VIPIILLAVAALAIYISPPGKLVDPVIALKLT